MGVAMYAISLLTAVMAYKGIDTSTAIAIVAAGVGAANSYEKAQKAIADAKAKLSGKK